MDLTRKQKLQDAMKRGIIGGHDIFTPYDLIDDVMLNMDVDLDNKNIAVLYNIEWVISLLEDWEVDPKNITFFGASENKEKLTLRFGCKYYDVSDTKKFFEEDIDMKFDVIVGNPPYQDGNKKGGQNKIYNQISKKAILLLHEDGIIAFITPTSVLKKSKRFSLIGRNGLKHVNFTANDYFTEGVNICYWVIDKMHHGEVTVAHNNGIDMQNPNQTIHNYDEVDRDFSILYEKLKEVTNTPDKRMFQQNNFGPALNKTQTEEHKYKLYKLNNHKVHQTYFSKRKPHNLNKLQISLGMTKALNEECIYVGKEDFDPGYMNKEVQSKSEVSNIKSFILSDYFIEHSINWKTVDGYGYNYALKYLPPFDTSKHWTSEEVKEFIEGFVK